MSFAGVTDSLGLPPAPSIFAGTDWGSGETDFPLTFLQLPPLPDGPPPDPLSLYCPPGAELYPHQSEGVDFLLANPVALLGDEMGLGKSIQAIAALRLLIHREEVHQALILCPKNILFDWYYKFRQWAPDLRVVPVEGPRRRRTWYWRCKVHVNIVGYETWREDLKSGLIDPEHFDLVILDEIQRIKNPNTAVHQAVAALDSSRRWGLSGTPMENRVDELVAVFAYLKPGLLPYGKGYAPATVRHSVAPFVLRRRKHDVLELPPKEHSVVWLDLTPVQRMAYEAAERAGVQAIRQAGLSAAPMLALALLTRLKQICNLDPPSGSSCKMTYLEEELRRLTGQEEKALIFSQYPLKSLKPLLPRLAPYGAALFDGSMSDWHRQLLIHRFQQTDEPQVLAMSLKCGGVGITLTRATHVYHFDHWWNPAVAEQAEDRAHRIGQKKPVHVTTLLTRGTVEERIAELQEQKRALFREVMEPLTEPADDGTESEVETAALSKALSREDLMGLFGIQEGAQP